MATLVRLQALDPQDILDTYGAGALMRLERDTVSTMATASEIATVAVVAATTEYEHTDATGVAGTHWYRVRYSSAVPTLPVHWSGYGPVFQAGALGGEVIALETAKTWQGISDVVDDPWLPIAIGAINGAAIDGIGVDIGPSPDTTRTYDLVGADGRTLTTQNGRRRWIPGGIRAFTKVEVSSDEVTWTDVTTSVRIGPAVHERPGEPGAYIEVRPYSTGIVTLAGWLYVRITGTAFETFGWDAYPLRLVQACAAALQRMVAERDGRGAYPTETDAARYLNPAVLRRYHDMYFPSAR